MGALYGHGEFRIGESEIDNGAQPVALKLLGNGVTGQLGHEHDAESNPEGLAADAAVETVEKIEPVHRYFSLETLIAQQFVDAGLGAGPFIDALDDDGTIEIRAG